MEQHREMSDRSHQNRPPKNRVRVLDHPAAEDRRRPPGKNQDTAKLLQGLA